MGTTCCTGRINLPKTFGENSVPVDNRFEVDYSEDSSHNNSRYFDSILSLNHKEVQSSPNHMNQSVHIDHGTSFGINDSTDKQNLSQILNPQDTSKYEDTIVEPEQESDFEYDIDTASQLPTSLRNNIVNLFSKHGIQEECMDGFLDVIEYFQDGSNLYKTLVISTEAVYVVDPDEFAVVDRRIPLQKMLLMCITPGRDFLGLKIQGEDDFVGYSGRMEDLVKAIQSVYNSKLDNYLPTVTVPTLESFFKSHNNSATVKSLFYSETSLESQRVICRHGVIGESILHFGRGQKVIDNSIDMRYILLTDRAYYSLHSTYRLEKRLDLSKILEVIWDKPRQTIVIQSVSSTELWKLPQSYIDNVKEAIARNKDIMQESLSSRRAM